MPKIIVDDEVFAAMQAEAKPFVDHPNDVLRRKFGLSPVPAAPQGVSYCRSRPMRGQSSGFLRSKVAKPQPERPRMRLSG